MMRPLLLAQTAMEAESLRLRYQMRRTVMRVLFSFIATMFVLGAIISGHAAAWYWLRELMAEHYAALVIGGADLLAALVLLAIAARSSPGPVEREALALRRRALLDARHCMELSVVLTSILTNVVKRWSR